MVPILEKLFADGALHSYTIDRENIHSDDPGTMFVVFVANGAEGLDKSTRQLRIYRRATLRVWRRTVR